MAKAVSEVIIFYKLLVMCKTECRIMDMSSQKEPLDPRRQES